MAKCDQCGRQENMPYRCRYCGGTYCGEHRLPENHACPGLENWNDPKGVFDSGFDDSVRHSEGRSGGVLDSIPGVGAGETLGGRGGVFAYFRGNVAYTFLALMWVTFLLQWVVLLVGPRSLYASVFLLDGANVLYVWTWVTSIFAHSPLSFFHIVGNSIVLYFFGPVVEQRVGSRAFAALFLVSGVVAGLGQVTLSLAMGEPSAVLGASGAILAVLGVLTVLNPKLTVYLYFLLPLPLWVITIAYAVLSVAGILSPEVNVLGGNVAHAAHLAGLVIGLVYGEYLRRNGQAGPQQLRFGANRGPGGPGGRF